jgi:hypothetical protein
VMRQIAEVCRDRRSRLNNHRQAPARATPRRPSAKLLAAASYVSPVVLRSGASPGEDKGVVSSRQRRIRELQRGADEPQPLNLPVLLPTGNGNCRQGAPTVDCVPRRSCEQRFRKALLYPRSEATNAAPSLPEQCQGPRPLHHRKVLPPRGSETLQPHETPAAQGSETLQPHEPPAAQGIRDTSTARNPCRAAV